MNPCIPDASQSSIIYLAMTQYLKGSWFLVVQVLHLRGAGWSGLFSGVLPAELKVTIPDGFAPTGASLTGGTGVSEVSFPTPATGLVHFALL